MRGTAAVRAGARESPLWTHGETLANLRVLEMNDCLLSCEIPAAIGQCVALEELTLAGKGSHLTGFPTPGPVAFVLPSNDSAAAASHIHSKLFKI
mgnify:CR=1 FL=1